jgi:hypothetical protein
VTSALELLLEYAWQSEDVANCAEVVGEPDEPEDPLVHAATNIPAAEITSAEISNGRFSVRTTLTLTHPPHHHRHHGRTQKCHKQEADAGYSGCHKDHGNDQHGNAAGNHHPSMTAVSWAARTAVSW